MDLELLTIPGCPHADPARELFRTALDLEGVKGPLTVRRSAPRTKRRRGPSTAHRPSGWMEQTCSHPKPNRR